ncbi:predicted protein [Lodderomyces elongisporus NRRL YB-4239]|uniref:Uncharacterized protein n=1 Tax=Lodderomyces elongisporus (strain ATCC 11503 / CBS 2605 / JCM 1781 / NBRC 1676 / NRRL YB-4239) TaxID=379508 RepID=A5DRT0_LODEL|nr:predicted protein [Lodderomyces elongisporus NRRL YB-4239]
MITCTRSLNSINCNFGIIKFLKTLTSSTFLLPLFPFSSFPPSHDTSMCQNMKPDLTLFLLIFDILPFTLPCFNTRQFMSAHVSSCQLTSHGWEGTNKGKKIINVEHNVKNGFFANLFWTINVWRCRLFKPRFSFLFVFFFFFVLSLTSTNYI